MIEKRFTKEEFEDCPRFIPIERDVNYTLFDIVDTEKLEFVGFIEPYYDIKECKRDCNIMNVIDYLIKEVKND